MGEMGNAYNISMGKLEEERPLGRPRHSCEDNIRIDLKERGSEGAVWINLIQDRDLWWAFVTTVINLRAPIKAGSF
jgi:hypothetical protein